MPKGRGGGRRQARRAQKRSVRQAGRAAKRQTRRATKRTVGMKRGTGGEGYRARASRKLGIGRTPSRNPTSTSQRKVGRPTNTVGMKRVGRKANRKGRPSAQPRRGMYRR